MATIDLGKIKMVWRGAYDNATAYTPDDVVSSGGTSYICILASTGNAVTNTTYWNVLAQGGTDVGTTLTTQGDILYRDGSGLQRLAKGTAAQVLKMNTAANAPEWGNLSSDCVKVASWDFSSAVSAVTLSNVFSNDYDVYKIHFFGMHCASNEQFRWRLLDSSGNAHGNYDSVAQFCYSDEGSSENHSYSDNWNMSYVRPIYENCGQNNERSLATDCTLYNPYKTSQKRWFVQNSIIRSSNGYTYGYVTSGSNNDDANNYTQLEFNFHSGGNITGGHCRVYGLKN